MRTSKYRGLTRHSGLTMTDVLDLELAVIEALYLNRKVWMQHPKDTATVLRVLSRPIGWSDPDPHDRLIWLECQRESGQVFRTPWTTPTLVEEDNG